MSTVAASIVKDLREQTNCPMIDCKKALVDAVGDFDAAKKLLRERLGNLDSAKPDSGTEGVIALVAFKEQNQLNRACYVIVEVGCETDFTANNPSFIHRCQDIACNIENKESILGELRATTKENVVLRRHAIESFVGHQFSSTNDVSAPIDIGSYVHHNRKIASVVVFDGLVSDEIKKSIAMHIVAATPLPVCITPEEVPENLVQTEREFFMKKAEGKPQNIQEKIVEGGLAKFKATLALNEQPLIMDPSKKVKDILPSGVKIVHFICWKI
jgi:elongation factor Ts